MLCQKEPVFVAAGHFCAAAPLPYPSRFLDLNVLLWGLSGEHHISVEGKDYTLGKDDLVLLPARVSHGGDRPCTPNAEHLWCHFTTDIRLDFPVLFHPARPEKIRILFQQLVDSNGDPSLANDSRRVICTAFLRILLEQAQAERERAETEAVSPLYYKLADWIRVHADDGITVQDVSEAFGYNSNYLTTLFRKQAGIPLIKYINRQKIANAQERLINTTYAVREIAYLSGFRDEKHFLKQFREFVRQTPTEFRRAICHARTNFI